MHPYRVFTLEQANHAVPAVARLTRSVQQRLDQLRSAFDETDPTAAKRLESETRDALGDWQVAVFKLGAQPKGIFTVDFRSPDPNVLWCWTVEEMEITHRHFTWESFKDRVPVEIRRAGWPGSN